MECAIVVNSMLVNASIIFSSCWRHDIAFLRFQMHVLKGSIPIDSNNEGLQKYE
jgi:hypothetical protein